MSLSEVDRGLLELVCAHRVVHQGQLEQLLPGVPERTLRYRTRRLHSLGLVGRSRPYRERGSAPWHLWPTRRADAQVRGDPPPRGGERTEPGPVFVAHAAALTELYVALVTQPPAGVVLEQFQREREAREGFRDRSGRQRAIAPDATIYLRDQAGRLLVGFVEVDLGTMSRARLRTKARGYAAYAEREGWTERHSWCPVLLFITTGPTRARAFCDLLRRELAEPSRYGTGERMAGAACAQAADLAGAVTGSDWRDLAGDENLTMLDCLRQARRGYDQWELDERTRRQHAEQERARLRADPQALREHFAAQRISPYLLEDRFGQSEGRALALLLADDTPVGEVEQPVLDALAGEDPLQARIADAPRDEQLSAALRALAADRREAQQHRAVELAERYGEGPHLRDARERLATGDVLTAASLAGLAEKAAADQRAREHQATRRVAYEQRRESEARRLARARGLSTRLLRGPEPFLDQADRRWLRFCPDCRETSYPEPDEQPDPDQPGTSRACVFCGRPDLELWPPARVASDAAASGSAGSRA